MFLRILDNNLEDNLEAGNQRKTKHQENDAYTGFELAIGALKTLQESCLPHAHQLDFTRRMRREWKQKHVPNQLAKLVIVACVLQHELGEMVYILRKVTT